MGRTCHLPGGGHPVHSGHLHRHPELPGQPRQLRRLAELRESAGRLSIRRGLDRNPKQHHHLVDLLHAVRAGLRAGAGRSLRPGGVRDSGQVVDLHAPGHLVGGSRSHLEIHVLVPAAWKRPDRDFERDRHVLPSRSRGLAAGSVAERTRHSQQPCPHRRRDVGHHRFCHGDSLCSAERHPRRAARGRPSGRCWGNHRFQACHLSADDADHRRGGHHPRHLRLEGFCGRVCDDERQLQHRRARIPHVQPALAVAQPGRGERGRDHPAHRGGSRADLQSQAVSGCGGKAMSVAAAARTESTAAFGSMQWISQRLGRIVLHVVVIGLTLAWVVPTLGLVLSSFRPFSAIATSGWWAAISPPYAFTLDNYNQLFAQSNLGTAIFNSFMVSVPSTVIPVTIAAFAAYAFAWMKFPARDWIFLAFVGLLAVPLQLTFIPVLKFYVDHGITIENLTALNLPPWVGLWLAHAGYGLPFSTYLLANFFRALPSDLFESAEIDGAGTLTVFFRIILPLSVPALASLVIFQFLWVWNDLLVALIYVGGSPEVAPLTVNLAGLTNSLGQGYQLLTAAAFFSMIVPLVVFLSLQRYFVRGILAGSVKG